MAPDLGVATLPAELVPGDPSELDELAEVLSGFARRLVDAADGLLDLDAGGWEGPAAEAFRELVGEQPRRYDQAAEAFIRAASAIARYAEVVRRAQGRATRGLELQGRADELTRAWDDDWRRYQAEAAANPVPPLRPPDDDPGRPDRAGAQRMVDEARDEVDTEARVLADTLAAAEEHAPRAPGLLASLLDGLGQFFGGLFADGAGGALGDAWGSVTALLDDPGAWVVDTWDGIYELTAVWNWDEFSSAWVGFGKDFTAWDEWGRDWRRALGQVSFNVVTGLGAGALAKRLLGRSKAGSEQLAPETTTPESITPESVTPQSFTPEQNRARFPPLAGAPSYAKLFRSPKSDRHILGGDGYGQGGHRPLTGFPGKTEFPDDWSDERILRAVDEAAQNPIREWRLGRADERRPQYTFIGHADGLEMFVVVDPSGRLASAFPTRDQPGVYENPKKPTLVPEGVIENRPIWKRPDPIEGRPGHFVYHRPDGTTLRTDEWGRLLPYTDVLPPVPAEDLTLDEKD